MEVEQAAMTPNECKILRMQLGYSMQAMADMLGLSLKSIKRIEAGTTTGLARVYAVALDGMAARRALSLQAVNENRESASPNISASAARRLMARVRAVRAQTVPMSNLGL